MNDINKDIPVIPALPAGTDLNTLEAAELYKPFCDELGNTPMVLLGDEQKERICDTLKAAFKTLGEAFGRFAYSCRIVASKFEKLKEACKISAYPDKKIVHLALHSKKARVRKKNRNRILKDYGMK